MNPFIDEGESFVDIGAVAARVGTFETMEDEAKFLDAYCEFSYHGYGNLRYFLGDPYWVAYQKHHPFNDEIKTLKERLKLLESVMHLDFHKSKYAKRGMS